MRRAFLSASALALASSLAVASTTAVEGGTGADRATFVYDDLQQFAEAHDAITRGREPLDAMQGYIDAGSPAFAFYAQRYGVTAGGLVSEMKKRPKFYARLARLEPRLRGQESVSRAGLSRLAEFAGSETTVPIYFLVANQVAGGTPVELDSEKPPALGIAIAIDMVSMAPEVDMAEFPDGPSGRASLDDIPYVAIHEMVHVHQARAQGGLENYRSIYRPGPNSTNLAVAVREGCADYLTVLASGLRRTGAQETYGRANERLLWTEFQKVMNAPAFSAPGWFSGTSERFPEWPSQIGYWLGGEICAAYHETAPDKDAAVRDMFAAYRPEQVTKFAAAYARKFAD